MRSSILMPVSLGLLALHPTSAPGPVRQARSIAETKAVDPSGETDIRPRHETYWVVVQGLSVGTEEDFYDADPTTKSLRINSVVRYQYRSDSVNLTARLTGAGSTRAGSLVLGKVRSESSDTMRAQSLATARLATCQSRLRGTCLTPGES